MQLLFSPNANADEEAVCSQGGEETLETSAGSVGTRAENGEDDQDLSDGQLENRDEAERGVSYLSSR